ncbi:MAG: hypothetical protein EAZ44_07475 [Cytophagia bacterium]|nr:MAG: hypothetical protein EAZ44_07475 [Cytophagia bacterium]TAG40459.1 MAG: hypothetical protein EAZ31_08395 [Cytophagia bacterium]TAH29741.1 MAG: hypothetical protein EAZ06_05790 [Cytophagales bacterium]
MKNYIILIAFMAILFTSCKTSEEIIFKKDFSGQMITNIDYKQTLEMMKAMSAQKNEKMPEDSLKMVIDQMLSKVKESYEPVKSIKGISNFKMDMNNDDSYKISFNFTDVAALNQAYNKLLNANKSMNEEKMMPDNDNKVETKTATAPLYNYFTLKSKELTYSRPKEEGNANNEGQMGEISKMMEYNLKISFENRKIKKITNENKLDLKTDENSVNFSPSVETLQKGLSFKIKLK